MTFKKFIIVGIVFFMAFITHVPVRAGDEEAEIGIVPWLLSATGDRNALFEECNFGDAAADALRNYLDADISIVNGGDLIGNLPPGEITIDELNSSIVSNRTLATVEVTAIQLRSILEAAVSGTVVTDENVIDTDASAHAAFPQVSGFVFYYNPTAPTGQRVNRILIDNKTIDLQNNSTKFTLAATEFMFKGGYGMPFIDNISVSSITLNNVMAEYIKDGLDDYSRPGHRVIAMGIRGNGTFSRSAIGLIAILGCLLFALFSKPKSIKTAAKKQHELKEQQHDYQ